MYPGSFNPATIAHLALAEAAREQAGLDAVELVVSEVALGKEHHAQPSAEERVAALSALTAGRNWLTVRRRREQLVADLAVGYDAVVMGSDKWLQVLDPAWYGGSVAERDRALARLPLVLVAPRANAPLPERWPTGRAGPGRWAPTVMVLSLPDELAEVSSTAVRLGRLDWAVRQPTPGGPRGGQPAGHDDDPAPRGSAATAESDPWLDAQRGEVCTRRVAPPHGGARPGSPEPER